MTHEERDEAIAKILADPEAFKRETNEAALRENPKLTPEQLGASWAQMAEQFGLE